MSGKADQRCCVPACGKTRQDNVILHTFPNPNNHSERFRTWLYAIGGDILVLDNQHIFKYRRVCHDHFETRYYTSSKRLSANAVPTLHLPGFSVQGATVMDIHNNKNIVSVETEDLQKQQPSTSKGFSVQGASVMDIHINNNIVSVETEDVQKQQPSTSKGLPKERKYLAKIFSSEASTLTRQIKKLRAAKDKFAARLKSALKLSENSTFQKALRNFTSAALIFTLLQFREINKNKMGRRFTKKEKIMALALYKQGPKAYRWLRHAFVLPSPLTLSRIISRADIQPGINKNLFKELKIRVEKMRDAEKLCILLFDEIAIAPHFDFNRKNDCITGFVTNSSKKIADHALVFMIRGVLHNYKQPIAYTFCSGSTSRQDLAEQIKVTIEKLKSIGLKVIATVCDQGASNMSAINALVQETKAKYLRNNTEFRRNTFEIDDEEVVPLYDPPHLIKGIRNNLLNKNLKCKINNEEKTAKWDHIVKLYAENPAYQGIRLLPKLTEQHVNPQKILKMKVKCATQVFSRSVAVNMGYLADKGILESQCKETADIILFFDELFDSVNGGYENAQRRSGKPLLGALTPKSCHHKVWTASKPVLKSMKYVDDKGKSCIVPSIRNWLWTIENLEYLKEKIFLENNFKSIWLRHFNQDPLENFFGCIRSHGYRNTNPTCAGFGVAFASLLINNLSSIHSPGSNCEKDSCHAFKSLKKMFFTKSQTTNNPLTEINFDYENCDQIFVGVNNKKDNPKVMAPIEYVTGYILRRTKKVFGNCKTCHSFLYDPERQSSYLRLKDYAPNKGYLSYPSGNLIECFSDIQDVTTFILRENSSMTNIKNYIKTIVCIVCNFNFIKCEKHKDELVAQIQELSCTFFLNNWCRDTNKLLKGCRQDFDATDPVQKMAREYYLKRKK